MSHCMSLHRHRGIKPSIYETNKQQTFMKQDHLCDELTLRLQACPLHHWKRSHVHMHTAVQDSVATQWFKFFLKDNPLFPWNRKYKGFGNMTSAITIFPNALKCPVPPTAHTQSKQPHANRTHHIYSEEKLSLNNLLNTGNLIAWYCNYNLYLMFSVIQYCHCDPAFL